MYRITLDNDIIIRKEEFGGLLFIRYNDVILELDPILCKFLSELDEEKYLYVSSRTYRMLKHLIKNNILHAELYNSSNEIAADLPDPTPISYQRNYLTLPNVLAIEITNSCNMNCIHCYQNGYHSNDFMPFEQFKILVDELAEKMMFSIAIIGGEPFMHPQLREIIDYCLENRINARLSTNGSLLNEQWIDYIAQNEPYLKLQISLDSGNPTLNKILRGNNHSLDQLRENIALLKSKGVTINIGSTISSRNFSNIEQLILFCIENKVDYLHFSPMMPVSKEFEGGDNLTLQDRRELNKVRRKLIKKYRRSIKIEFSEMIIDPRDRELKKKVDKNSITFGLCGAGKTRATVKVDGTLLPCDILRDLECGNVFGSSFTDVWENSYVLEEIRNRRSHAKGSCTNCEIYAYCEGECLQYALRNHGTISVVEPVCR